MSDERDSSSSAEKTTLNALGTLIVTWACIQRSPWLPFLRYHKSLAPDTSLDKEEQTRN
jgi:hypothetical protein